MPRPLVCLHDHKTIEPGNNRLWNRDACSDVDSLKTTITKDNEASWALFRKFAKKLDGDLTSEAHFKEDDHFDGQHSTEHMVTIDFTVDLKKAA